MAPTDAGASGAYQEYRRFCSFLIAPPRISLEGGATRTSAPTDDAVAYTLSARLPLGRLLLQPEIPYISRITSGDIHNGFGDFSLRVRVRAWGTRHRVVHFLSGVRVGGGPFLQSDAGLFPYSTGSVDLEIGLAFVDTVASVTWWLSSTGTYPSRVDDVLKQTDLYGTHATLGAGANVPLPRGLDIHIAALAYLASERRSREIYLLDLEWETSDMIGFYGFAQAEGGSRPARAVDFAFGLGTRVSF